MRAAKELEFEGVIAKRKGSVYEPGKRSGAWLKYKINKSQEFIIGGYTLVGNPFDALIVGCYDGGKLRYVAKVRAGIRAAHPLRPWFLLFRKLVTEECPFYRLPRETTNALFAYQRGNAELPVAKTRRRCSNPVSRMDTGWPFAAPEFCGIAK